jgi:hypothetical protein
VVDRRRWRDIGASILVLTGVVVVTSATSAGAAPFVDDFNRADSTDLGVGWAEVGTDLAISANQATNPAGSPGFAQAVGGGEDTASALVFAATPGTPSAYAAVAVRVTDATDMVMVRAQDDDGDGTFDRLVGTRGNAVGALIFDQELATGFAVGRLTVSSDGTHVTAGVDTGGDAEPEEILTATSPTIASGTGVGFGISNQARLDAFTSFDVGVDTTTTLTAAPNPSTFGQPVTFSADVVPTAGGPATGTVVFSIDGVGQPPVALVAGSASLTTSALTAGSHEVTATYEPDTFAFDASSTIDAITQDVLPAATTTTVTDVDADATSTYGDEVIFSVSVSSSAGTPTGAVELLDGATSLGTATLTAGTATFEVDGLDIGAHAISVDYAGTTDLAPSSSLPVVHEVEPAGTALDVADAGPTAITVAVDRLGVGVTAAVAAGPDPVPPSGTVTVTAGGATLGSAALDADGRAVVQLSGLAPGANVLTVTYSGDAEHDGSSAAFTKQGPGQGTTTSTTDPTAPTTTTTAAARASQLARTGQTGGWLAASALGGLLVGIGLVALTDARRRAAAR